MIKIGIAGGPGTGKTTLSRALTNVLNKEHGMNAQYVSEFARDFINVVKTQNNNSYIPALTDQAIFIDRQIERETLFPPTVTHVVTDSPIFLPLVYTLSLCNIADPQGRAFYLFMYEKTLATLNNLWTAYDHIFLLDNSKPYIQDGTRIQTAEESAEITAKIKGFLDFHGYRYVSVNGVSDEDRLSECIRVIVS